MKHIKKKRTYHQWQCEWLFKCLKSIPKEHDLFYPSFAPLVQLKNYPQMMPMTGMLRYDRMGAGKWIVKPHERYRLGYIRFHHLSGGCIYVEIDGHHFYNAVDLEKFIDKSFDEYDEWDEETDVYWYDEFCHVCDHIVMYKTAIRCMEEDFLNIIVDTSKSKFKVSGFEFNPLWSRFPVIRFGNKDYGFIKEISDKRYELSIMSLSC